MYLRRKIDNFLENWKADSNRKPLIIKGARQIGKTESIRNFAKNYRNFVNINFAEEIKYKTICEDGYDVDNVIKNISRITPSKRFVENETLIFLLEQRNLLFLWK